MANTNKDHARLTVLLNAYGSDITRWPEGERHLASELTTDQRARLFREDIAIDLLLRRAADAADKTLPSEALMSRIMEGLPAKGRGDQSGDAVATVIPFETRSGARTVGNKVGGPAVPNREWTAAAALLAASLMLGIFIGSTSQFEPTARGIGEMTGITGSGVQTSALDDALQINDDEEIL